MAELAVGLRRGKRYYEIGQTNLAILLEKTPDDGDLHFLMGQCQEALGNDKGAEKSYQSAIDTSQKGLRSTQG